MPLPSHSQTRSLPCPRWGQASGHRAGLLQRKSGLPTHVSEPRDGLSQEPTLRPAPPPERPRSTPRCTPRGARAKRLRRLPRGRRPGSGGSGLLGKRQSPHTLGLALHARAAWAGRLRCTPVWKCHLPRSSEPGDFPPSVYSAESAGPVQRAGVWSLVPFPGQRGRGVHSQRCPHFPSPAWNTGTPATGGAASPLQGPFPGPPPT